MRCNPRDYGDNKVKSATINGTNYNWNQNMDITSHHIPIVSKQAMVAATGGHCKLQLLYADDFRGPGMLKSRTEVRDTHHL